MIVDTSDPGFDVGDAWAWDILKQGMRALVFVLALCALTPALAHRDHESRSGSSVMRQAARKLSLGVTLSEPQAKQDTGRAESDKVGLDNAEKHVTEKTRDVSLGDGLPTVPLPKELKQKKKKKKHIHLPAGLTMIKNLNKMHATGSLSKNNEKKSSAPAKAAPPQQAVVTAAHPNQQTPVNEAWSKAQKQMDADTKQEDKAAADLAKQQLEAEKNRKKQEAIEAEFQRKKKALREQIDKEQKEWEAKSAERKKQRAEAHKKLKAQEETTKQGEEKGKRALWEAEKKKMLGESNGGSGAAESSSSSSSSSGEGQKKGSHSAPQKQPKKE